MRNVFRYLIIYLFIGVIYAVISLVLDILFGYKIRYHGRELIEYALYFYIIYFMYVIPVIAAYNLTVENTSLKFSLVRQMSFITLIALFFAWVIQRWGLGFYIGEYKFVKNIIMCFLVGNVYSIANYFYLKSSIRSDESDI